MEQHLLTFPVIRQRELLTIGTRVVLCLTNKRRIALERGTPCIADILVDAVAMTVQLKQSWHREILPLRVVVVQCPEACRGILMVLYKLEAPHAFHRQVATGGLLLPHPCCLLVLVGKEVGTSSLTVLLINLWITPLWRIVGYCRRCPHHQGCQR